MSILAPASEHTQYELRRLFRSLDNNVYVGPPRKQYDEAWAKIIEPIVIKLTPDEWASAALADDTLSLADGTGHLVELAAYHELHCIKRIRRTLLYPAADYFNTTSASQRERDRFHVEHCLEYWREAAACRADPTLATLFWRDGVPTSRAYDDHECVDWDRFDAWARERRFDVGDLDELDQRGRWDLVSDERGGQLPAKSGADDARAALVRFAAM